MKKLKIALIAVSLIASSIVITTAQAQEPKQQIFSSATEIKVTESQKKQLQQIRVEVGDKIQAILTPEQKAKLQNAMKAQATKPNQNVVADVGLTSEQKKNLQALLEEARQQELEILTPQQREQIRQSSPLVPNF